MSENDKDVFYKIYDDAIEYHQKRVKELMLPWNSRIFSYQKHHTIQLNLGVDTFKTSFIVDRCDVYDIIIVDNPHNRRDMIDRLRELKKENVAVHTSSFCTTTSSLFRQMNFRYCWIDNPSSCFQDKKQLNTFFHEICQSGPEIVIMMGR